MTREHIVCTAQPEGLEEEVELIVYRADELFEARRLGRTPVPWRPDKVIQKAESVKAYCHMDKRCLGCSPQLVEGICPDSRAGRLFAEMLEALEYAVSKYGKPGGPWNVPSDPGGWLERSRAVIAKARGQQ